MSRAKSDEAPWQKWTDQMRLKTAIKRLCKLLPMPQPLEEFMENLQEDDDENDAAAPKPRALPRARGAQNTLEQFAGEPDPEPERGAADDAGVRGESGPSEPQGEPVPQVLIDTAHERGRQAKADGAKRTAIPGEYREADRAKEALAWRKGWDGEPLDAGGGHDGH